MKGKIFKLAEQIIHKAQDDFALTKKHMPSQNMRALELTNAILALEVEGKIKPTCNIPSDIDISFNCEIVKKDHPVLWVHCNNLSFECPYYKEIPATIRDLIGNG